MPSYFLLPPLLLTKYGYFHSFFEAGVFLPHVYDLKTDAFETAGAPGSKIKPLIIPKGVGISLGE